MGQCSGASKTEVWWLLVQLGGFYGCWYNQQGLEAASTSGRTQWYGYSQQGLVAVSLSGMVSWLLVQLGGFRGCGKSRRICGCWNSSTSWWEVQ